MYKIFLAWKLKNAFERASFWWQLSLTTWLSSTFHTAFHARKGCFFIFQTFRLPGWVPRWQLPLKAGSGRTQWMAAAKRRCKTGKQKGTVLAFANASKAPSHAICPSPLLFVQDYSTELKSLDRKHEQNTSKWSQSFSLPLVWEEDNFLT